MALFSKGTIDKTCEGCGSQLRVHYTDYPERDRGVWRCPVCGEETRWSGTRDFYDLEVVVRREPKHEG